MQRKQLAGNFVFVIWLLSNIRWVAGKGPMTEARWSDLAVAAAAADKPSSGSANPILTGAQAERRSAHKVLGCIPTTTIL